MTEEQALEKWCPFKLSGKAFGASCIASECMMWRRSFIQTFDDQLQQHVIKYDYGCGLAGKEA
jgi:hypothetical protein